MSSTIAALDALEVLDSRGRPTLRARVRLAGGIAAAASVPSGASRGAAEAVELRDGDSRRYRGLGCRRAVASVNSELAAKLVGRSYASQAELDEAIIAIDGSPQKQRLGANALLGVSLAFARAYAVATGRELFEHLALLVTTHDQTLPRPMINLFSGGKHAGGQVALQDVLVVPLAAATIDEALALSAEVIQCAAELVRETFGMRLLTADEGGLAPPFPSPESMIEAAIAAIEHAGVRPGVDVALAVDVAASHFARNGGYLLEDQILTSADMVARLVKWVEAYPVVAIEDGLGEEAWDTWPKLRSRLAERALVIGDDLLCTNPDRIVRARDAMACAALLLKPNQIGTLTEAARALQLAREAGWSVIASARSGDTEDDWLADLAVGWSSNAIKVGSLTQSERLAKYNRLLAIERTHCKPLAGLPPTRVGRQSMASPQQS